MDALVLSIIGGFLTLALGVNGFFLRGIYQDLNDLKVTVATWITGAKANKEELDELKEEYHKFRKRFHDQNNKIQDLVTRITVLEREKDK